MTALAYSKSLYLCKFVEQNILAVEIGRIKSVGEYSKLRGAETLHPPITVLDYDNLYSTEIDLAGPASAEARCLLPKHPALSIFAILLWKTLAQLKVLLLSKAGRSIIIRIEKNHLYES